MSETATRRICFQQWIHADRIEEYKRRHAAVWPEMLEALEAAGWRNYSLFLRPDGLLIGYVETDSLDAATARMAAFEVNARWQAEMADLFDGIETPPDESFVPLEEVFNLEDQLAAARAARPARAAAPATNPDGPRAAHSAQAAAPTTNPDGPHAAPTTNSAPTTGDHA